MEKAANKILKEEEVKAMKKRIKKLKINKKGKSNGFKKWLGGDEAELLSTPKDAALSYEYPQYLACACKKILSSSAASSTTVRRMVSFDKAVQWPSNEEVIEIVEGVLQRFRRREAEIVVWGGGLLMRLRLTRLTRYKGFKEGNKRILVATDLVGRGIDIERVNIVINYDMPDSADTYLHRVGRAGRFGTKGLAITFVSSAADSDVLNQVQERFEVDIKELPEQIDTSTYMPS